MNATGFLHRFADPGREYSLMPFWFWNDDLDEDEIARQMADFERHGVYGFVIHPRVGLRRIPGGLHRLLSFVALPGDSGCAWETMLGAQRIGRMSGAAPSVARLFLWRAPGPLCRRD